MAGKENESIQDALPNELIMLLSSLAQKWGDTLDPSIKTAKHLSGAMTNAVYAVSWPAKEGTVTRRVLVRIYGKGIHNFFDRDDEVRIFEFVSNNGHGPSLLEKGKEGRIEEFIDAKTLSASDQRDPEISTLIAKKLREFHTIELPGTKEPAIWGRLRKWLEKAKGLCSTERIEELGDLEEEINLLEDELSREEQEIVFCHNDLQNGNIMIKDKTITLIDYEYASYNPIAYEFANHFCEMAANYDTETPHVLDYSRYPGSEERLGFISSYLSCAGKDASVEEVKRLANMAEKYSLASHLFWGLWGVISDEVNNIDFKYLEYSKQRFKEYRLKKAKVLGKSAQS